jgi:hypothetical protein
MQGIVPCQMVAGQQTSIASRGNRLLAFQIHDDGSMQKFHTGQRAVRITLSQMRTRLWWLLGTSVRESAGCALDFFTFLGAMAFTDQRMQEHFSCLPGSCRAYAVHFLIRRKLTGRRFQARQEHDDAWNALSSDISASLLWSSSHSSVFVV